MDNSLKTRLLAYLVISAITFACLVMPYRASISVPIFIVVQFVCLWFLVPRKKPLLMFIPIFILGLNSFISSNNIWHISNFIVVVALYGVMVLWITDKLSFMETSVKFFIDIAQTVFRPFGFFKVPVEWGLETNKAQLKILKRVLLGVVIAIPCLVILIVVLSSADQVFSGGVNNTLAAVQDLFSIQIIVKIVGGLIVGFYLFGLIYSVYRPYPDTPYAVYDKRGDLIVINIVLLSILFVYTLFAIVQFRYLFASGINLPYGLTYTSYARRGFFELLFLSGVNILIILFLIQLTKKHSGSWANFTRVLLCYLCVITFILLISSFYRMWLYNMDGGLTRLRFLVLGFLVFEALGLVFTFIYIVKPKFNIILVYLSLGLVYYVLLNIVPMDAIIAKDQIDRYYATGHGDLGYVLSLSGDAAPQIARLLQSDDTHVKANVNYYFKKQNDKKAVSWQSFNWSAEKCRLIFKQTTAALNKAAQSNAATQTVPVPDVTVPYDKPKEVPTVTAKDVSQTGTATSAAEVSQNTIKTTTGSAGIAIPANTKIYAAGMHSGEALDWQIDDSGEPATLGMVSVNSPTQSVVLVLSAYAPTVWHVGWTEGTQIVAVVISGWNTQVILGLPPEVPVISSTLNNKGPFEAFFMRNSEGVRESSQVTKKLFGRSVDRAYDISKGQIRMGATLPPNAVLLSYAEPPQESMSTLLITSSSGSLFSYMLPQIIEHEIVELENYDGMVYTEPPAISGDLQRVGAQADDLLNLQLPPDTKIYAVRAAGGKELDWQIDASGLNAGLINVLVNSPKEPVVLLLGAHNPTIWHVGWYQDSLIMAVITSGEHTQKVIGLPADVPLIHSPKEGDDFESDVAYVVNLLEVDGADQISRKFFGRSVDRAFKMIDGRVVIGDAVPPGLKPITYAQLREENFQDGRPLAGRAGLEEAVRQGLIKKADESDLQQYLALEGRKMDLPEHILAGKLHGANGVGRDNTYVVLSPNFVIPPGLTGAYAVNFILPSGMSRPAGNVDRGLIMSYDVVNARTTPDSRVTGIHYQPDFLNDTPATCAFPDLQLPQTFKVYAAGNYFGRKLNPNIENDDYRYVMQVTVNSPDEPVVLFLGSSCRALWHVSWTEGTEIAAVFVSGRRKPEIIGLPESVPVKINEEYDRNGCPWFEVNPRLYNLVTINTMSKLFFGKDLDGVFYAEDGVVGVGAPVAENTHLESAQLLDLE